MTRLEFENLVLDMYSVKADYPFEDDFETGVFRHTGTGKWFAIAMNVKASKLGKSEGENIDIVNLKCAPEVIETLVLEEAGIYPAYHMNKEHWSTVIVGGDAEHRQIMEMIAESYELTAKKGKRK